MSTSLSIKFHKSQRNNISELATSTFYEKVQRFISPQKDSSLSYSSRNSSNPKIRLPQIRSISKVNGGMSQKGFQLDHYRTPSTKITPNLSHIAIQELTAEQFFKPDKKNLRSVSPSKSSSQDHSIKTQSHRVICFCASKQGSQTKACPHEYLTDLHQVSRLIKGQIQDCLLDDENHTADNSFLLEGLTKLDFLRQESYVYKLTDIIQKQEKEIQELTIKSINFGKLKKENQTLKESLQELRLENDKVIERQKELSQANTAFIFENEFEHNKIQDVIEKLRKEHNHSKKLEMQLKKRDIEISNLLAAFEDLKKYIVEMSKDEIHQKFGEFELQESNLKHDEAMIRQLRKQKKIAVAKELNDITLQRIVTQAQITSLAEKEKLLINRYSVELDPSLMINSQQV